MNRIESCIVAAYPHHLLQLTADKSGGHFAAALKIEQEKETARHDKARREEAQRQPDNATDNRPNWHCPLLHCGATTIVAIVCLCVWVCVCALCDSNWKWAVFAHPGHAVSPLPMGCNWQKLQQLVAVVAHFLSELTIAVRLLTVMICPTKQSQAGGPCHSWGICNLSSWQINWLLGRLSWCIYSI